MSPIGRIFIVLNLILSAVFAGWAANNLTASENFKQQLADSQSQIDALTAEKDGEISAQATKISQLESAAQGLRSDTNTLEAEKTRLEGELANARQQSSALQSDLTGIRESLDNYAENNRNIQQRLDQAIANEKSSDAARREAEDAREDALNAQRSAAESLSTAENSVASLERDREDLRFLDRSERHPHLTDQRFLGLPFRQAFLPGRKRDPAGRRVGRDAVVQQ